MDCLHQYCERRSGDDMSALVQYAAIYLVLLASNNNSIGPIHKYMNPKTVHESPGDKF